MPKPIPDGYHSLTPAVTLKDARKAIAFYQKAFGARVIHTTDGPDGKFMHGELQLGDSRFLLGEESPAWPQRKSAQSLGGSPITLAIYCEDADAQYKQAVAAGAKPVHEPNDAFWGDRYAQVKDPFGYDWMILTHVKDLTPEQIAKAACEAFAQPAKK